MFLSRQCFIKRSSSGGRRAACNIINRNAIVVTQQRLHDEQTFVCKNQRWFSSSSLSSSSSSPTPSPKPSSKLASTSTSKRNFSLSPKKVSEDHIVDAYTDSISLTRNFSHPRDHNDEAANTAAEAMAEAAKYNHEHPRFPKLFTPLDLGPDIGYLPNRVLMGSMHTGLEGSTIPKFILPYLESNHDGVHPLEKMAIYFQHRAKGGAGLMVTGGISPNFRGTVALAASKLSTHDEMMEHKIVTELVHGVTIPTVIPKYRSGQHSQKGQPPQYAIENIPSRICLQILHAGRYAYHPFAVTSTTSKSPISPFKAKGMSSSEVDQTVYDYINTSVLAKEAGYDGVEVMGSEGYLLSQFFTEHTNKRPKNDPYTGSSLEGRSKLALDIVQGIRDAVGPDFIIIFRLSLLDLVNKGLSMDECVLVTKQLRQCGVTILNTGIGWHEARIPTISSGVPRGAFIFPTQILKSRLLQEQENLERVQLSADDSNRGAWSL